MPHSPYWIKLHIKTLDSYTMSRLPDYLWRRAIELFLLAGENGNDGQLQPVAEIAWRLRIDETKATENLEALSQVGVVEKTRDGGWKVTNFEKYQTGSAESSSRVKRFRDKKKMESQKDEVENVENSVTCNVTCNVTGNALEENREEENRIDVTSNETSNETPFSKLSVFVANLMGVPEFSPNPLSWNKAINRFVSSGVKEEDIRSGFEDLMQKGDYTLVGAQSIVTAAINAKLRREFRKNGSSGVEVLSPEEQVRRFAGVSV